MRERERERTAQLVERDRRYLWHPFTQMKAWMEEDEVLVIERGEGCWLVDTDGNRYLDGVSSLWCNVHGHRVPAIACWPGRIKPGSTCDQTVLGMDLFPTMAAAAKANLPAGLDLDGVDLTGLLTRGDQLPKRTLFWAYKNQQAVRKGPWKLLIQGNTERLFNLDNDLAEQNNLAPRHPERVASLRAELVAWQRDVSTDT